MYGCKSCLKNFIKMVEGVPHHLNLQIHKVMDRLSTIADSSYIDIGAEIMQEKKDLLNSKMQMERMSYYVNQMKRRVEKWKEVIE